uniref:TOG domain-containing protein n=1 Tax=Haptolina ericina TaxID=156174 RepID=A0A7S3EVC3_9EUKA|mmetsp:Transcript_22061/g.49814  ORF Transcript_22061/g.49814 Transcript_22061/m.49814 type:complete len:655 (+) Transcript_22061:55-2019(+)|eukprot:CAMPEP_0181193632 /NCGR_PEP_ID=MMETSP1096-20121128/13921_1 /TAXON_ID=156174 ORGANISM="Chrysochromulina ericina, Strain CCMP281" /NCGR_SAMPLE_ID=MMETSP1096 /ASSEMBLY_ACC=CAM_ASM_000453 /LENGTH=654 /DNA_ID=CAMNT_0023283109 /DNA_START=55 /DNA_END=2019 /DNA_ORIENTATION=-
MGDDSKSFVLAELESGDAVRVLDVIMNLKTISMALGPAVFRLELLPKLADWIETNFFPDEVVTKLASMFGELVDFVGGPKEAACLLSPLQSLCNYDETQVREAAVSAINTICAEMPSDLLKAEFVPIFQKLAGNSDWWAPRVSACGLVHTAYKAHTLQEDVNGRREMVKLFKALCADEPMVKSAAATKMGLMLDAMGANAGGGKVEEYMSDVEKHGANLSETFVELLKDDHDYVKVAAVRSSPAIFKYWSLDDPQGPGSHWAEGATDKSWRVRVAVAEVLADVATAAKARGSNLERVREICSKLMNDPEEEVKHAMGERCASVARALDETFAEEIFPQLKALALPTDIGVIVREKLVSVLMDMAVPLKKERAVNLIVKSGLLQQLCHDENTNVRLAVLAKLTGDFFLVVRASGDHQSELFETLRPLAGSNNWRVRHSVMLCLPKLVQVLQEDEPDAYESKMNTAFGFKLFFNDDNTEKGEKAMLDQYGKDLIALPWALDPIAQIRKDYGPMCKHICKLLKGTSPSRSSNGGTWATDHILPVLHFCCTHKEYKDRYHQRIILLMGLCHIGEYVPEDKVESAVKIILEMAREKLDNGSYVPSLRLMIARDLKGIKSAVSEGFLQKEVQPCLEEMEKDADPDVSEYAKESLAEIRAM